MNASRQKPSWLSHVAIAALICLAYPLSFGPACWVASRVNALQHSDAFRGFSDFYYPLAYGLIKGPAPCRKCVVWWAGLGMSAQTTLYDDWNAIFWSNPGYTYTLLSL